MTAPKGPIDAPIPDRIFYGGASNLTIEHGLTPVECRLAYPMHGGERIHGGFVLPPFQRPYVWDQARQIAFVESLWVGIAPTAYVVNSIEDSSGNGPDQWLIDGQQRWGAIYAFERGEFPIFGKVERPHLSARQARRWKMTSFPCMEVHLSDVDQLRDLYYRLAFGGVAHVEAAATGAKNAQVGDPTSLQKAQESLVERVARAIAAWPDPSDFCADVPVAELFSLPRFLGDAERYRQAARHVLAVIEQGEGR